MRSFPSPSSPEPVPDPPPDPSPGTANQEVEWQFDAVDLRPVDRWLRQTAAPAAGADRRVTASPNGVRRHTDVYADTSS